MAKAATAPAKKAAPSSDSPVTVDDVAVVLAALCDGDPMDAPDVRHALHKLRLRREELPDPDEVTA